MPVPPAEPRGGPSTRGAEDGTRTRRAPTPQPGQPHPASFLATLWLSQDVVTEEGGTLEPEEGQQPWSAPGESSRTGHGRAPALEPCSCRARHLSTRPGLDAAMPQNWFQLQLMQPAP